MEYEVDEEEEYGDEEGLDEDELRMLAEEEAKDSEDGGIEDIGD